MIEAELAVHGVRECNLIGYGRYSLSTFGSETYDRPPLSGTQVAGTDYDCSDFSNGAVAQRFFLASGGPAIDRYGLDGDGDGLACEWGTQVRQISRYRRPVTTVRPTSSRCYVGLRGGTYTISSNGTKNYNGC